MKKLNLIIVLMLCAGNLMAQTYCEKLLTNAKNLYKNEDYTQAKKIFEAVQKDCPEKDLAMVYMQLCDEKIKTIELTNQNKTLKQDKNELIKEKHSLQQSYDSLNQEKGKNEKNAAEISKLKNTNNKAQNRIKELDNKNKTLSDELVKKNEEIAVLKNTLDETKKDLESLNKPQKKGNIKIDTVVISKMITNINQALDVKAKSPEIETEKTTDIKTDAGTTNKTDPKTESKK